MVARSPLHSNTTQNIQTNHNCDYNNEDHYVLYSKGDLKITDLYHKSYSKSGKNEMIKKKDFDGSG